MSRFRRTRSSRRRGVASVLAMMFLVIFGSLAAAMAVVAQGNLRTADSAIKVSRAMSAAESGLVFAKRRLEQEGKRFVVDKGVITKDFAHKLWLGTYSAGDGNVEVLPPTGYESGTTPSGLAAAVMAAHLVDDHAFVAQAGDAALPDLDQQSGTLLVKPIRLFPGDDSVYFRLKYALVNDGAAIRVTSQGVDRGITRTLQMDFAITKRIEFAILSPNRLMIGKNVLIEGPLGTRFGATPDEADMAPQNGNPLLMRSDFRYLSAELDSAIDAFYSAVVQYDVDGDGRLRPEHPVEKQPLINNAVLVDYDGNEYVDDFDLFLKAYDGNGDKMVVYSSSKAAAAGLGSLAEEFSGVDDQLARLIDNALPDRNGDGVNDAADRALGWDDGVLDANDLYAKVRGRLAFACVRAAWENARDGDSYQNFVNGAIRTGIDVAPVSFEVSDEEMRPVTTEMFADSATWFSSNGSGDFDAQVTSNLSGTPGATYTAPGDTTWEDVPYGASEAGGAAYDWYQRPVYEGMVFTNVRIPVGTNALFKNCRFEGVTYIETTTDCDDVNWNYCGAVDRVESSPGVYTYPPKYPGLLAEAGGSNVSSTKPFSNNIRFHDCTFLGSISGDKPDVYTHWRNKMQLTGQTRFYIDENDPDLDAQPDGAQLASILSSMQDEDIAEMEKSSILMPGWSIDVGNFANEQAADPEETATVKLKGVIISGIMDVRGTADIFGTMLMTFKPVEGEGPLFYGGLPDAFNTTIGYFGPADGDGEGVDPGDATFSGFGEITIRYNPNAKLPDGIPWPISVRPDANTYVEGGSM